MTTTKTDSTVRQRQVPTEARFAPLPKPGRRFGAALIDFIIMIVLFFIGFYGVARPILNATSQIDLHERASNMDRHNSRLYTITYVGEYGEDLTELSLIYGPRLPQGVVGYTSAVKDKYLQSAAVLEFYTKYKYDRITESDEYIRQLYFKEGEEINEQLITFRKEANAEIEEQLNNLGLDVIDSQYITVHNFRDDPVTWFKERILRVDQPKTDKLDASIFESTGILEPNSKKQAVQVNAAVPEAHHLPPGVAIKEGKSAEADQFFANLYTSARNDLNAQADAQIINQKGSVAIILSLFGSSLIVYLLFPLVFKHGATLGKKLLSLGIVNTYGYKAKWWQIIARYIAFFLLTFMLDVFFIFFVGGGGMLPIFTFISFTMATFGKKNRALHDFIAGTRPVHLKVAKIYPDYESELKDNPIEEQVFVEEESDEEWVNFEDRLLGGPAATLSEEDKAELAGAITSQDEEEENKITSDQFESIFTRGEEHREEPNESSEDNKKDETDN